MSKITIQDFQQLAAERVPFAEVMGLQLQSIDDDGIWMRAVYNDKFLRPGGTISGPVMMGLADAAIYAMIMSRIGKVELAVTTSLNINFLRKPAAGDIIARATPLKFGKRLVVGDVAIYSDTTGSVSTAVLTDENMVAHATATYSIPQS